MNVLRGEVSLTGQSGKAYKLRLGSYALAQLQRRFEQPTLGALLQYLGRNLKKGDFSVADVLAIVQAGIEPEVSELEAGSIIDDCGIEDVLTAATTSLQASALLNSKKVDPQRPAPKRRSGAGS